MIHFAPGTPAAVRDLILELLANPNELSSRRRSAIERLAGNEEMESLWKTLPATLRGKKSKFIRYAVIAFQRSISIRPPLKQHMKEMWKFLERHAPFNDDDDPALMTEYRERFTLPLTYSSMAVEARTLRDDLKRIPAYARADWQNLWTGDQRIDFEKLLESIEATAVCCEELQREADQIEAAMNFPRVPTKRGGQSAAQVHFSDIMQGYFRRECGKPMAPLVAILLQVMFDLRQGVDESTVRKRSQKTGRSSRK
jgi:hypothetical protein